MSIFVDHITKRYGEQLALNDVSFDIPDGQIAGFLGPNGAGKSTMMKIITGYIPPTRGKVKVNGLDIDEASIPARRTMGYLPENNPLHTEMYVLEYLKFVAGIHKIRGKARRKRIEDLIELTGLGPERHKKIGALSKGYRQRVGLAQALLHEPKSLIMDEPTSGLDPNQIVEIRKLIKDIGREKTIMLSTHIMQEVEAICDRVIIISKGRIVADKASGELKNIMEQTSQSVEVEFDKNPDMGKIKALPGINHIEETGPMNYLVEGTQETDLRKTLFDFAVQNGMSVLSMQKKEQKMEDIFRELTNQA